MARGELIKQLVASYGREEEFRAVAKRIISEEEKKRNRVLARTLRRTLENIGTSAPPVGGLSRLVPFPDEAGEFIQRVDPCRNFQNILLSRENLVLFCGLIREFRQADRIRLHGLPLRTRLLFCGPPGAGKTLCAEVFAYELGLPLVLVRLDRLISSYLGETATNVRKTFEFARRQPCVLFFDEFDALGRSREETEGHGELRRVVNSLLFFIEQIEPRGFLIAATNLADQLDHAVWRRFDEIVRFDAPDAAMTRKYLVHAFRNVRKAFDPLQYADQLMGFSFADLERVCLQAIRLAVIGGNKPVSDHDFRKALKHAMRRFHGNRKMEAQAGD